ncbi:MAG: hypothetical protein WCZ43_07690, partial [Proteiniphilum sp.]
MNLKEFLDEIKWFAEPLFEATHSGDNLVQFFREFGYDLKSGDIGTVITAFESLTTTVKALVEGNAPENADPDLEKLLELFSVVKSVGDMGKVTSYFGTNFFEEVFDYLLQRYLSARHPGLLTFLSALGVFTIKEFDSGRDLPYKKAHFEWGRIADFVSDTAAWAREVYGWNGNTAAGDAKSLDYKFLFSNMADLFEGAGLSLAIFKKVTP